VRKEGTAPKDKEGNTGLFEMDPDEDVRGTSGIVGFYDQHFAIRTATPGAFEASPPLHLLLRSKDDLPHFYKLGWQISGDSGTATFTMDEITAQQTLDEMQREVEFVLSTVSEPISKKRIEEMLGLHDGAFLLRSMVEAGTLRQEGRGYVLAKAKELA
jgi:hypothetical protein